MVKFAVPLIFTPRMNALLYLPQQLPQTIEPDGLSVQVGFAQVLERVAVLLDCTPELVDVLASGPEYVAYSIFDSEGEVNLSAMVAVTEISGVAFEAEDEDAVLRGAVLIVRR